MNVVFHWWSEKSDEPPHANLRSPILLSIATLRATHPEIPICVLDRSEFEVDWSYFPQKLGFQVIRDDFALRRYNHRPGWRHLSRLFDLNSFGEDLFIYQDSDVFRIKSMFPLVGRTNCFCFNNNNSGFFYYDKNAMREFFEIFESYTLTALNNDDFRSTMAQYTHYDQWYYVLDETVLMYMLEKHPNLFCQIPPEEHTTFRNIKQVHDLKMLHCNGLMVSNPLTKNSNQKEHCRGLLCLAIQELYDQIMKVLDQKDLEMMFNEQERAYWKEHRCSFSDPGFVDAVLATKTATGHYHFPIKTLPMFI